MMRFKSFKAILMMLSAASLVGCVNSTVVNLTPSTLPRNAEGVYRFEAAWNSNQKSVRDASIKGFVVLDDVQYPMTRVPVVEDRWEALIPLDVTTKGYSYHLKFDYAYDSFPETKPNSLRSKVFTLGIREPNQ